LQWKALYESVILSLGIIVILCSMFSLLVEWCELPGNVWSWFCQCLKLDRMSLFSADLLRSGFLSYNGIGIMVVNKRKICSKNTKDTRDFWFPICFVDKICFGKDFVSRSQVEVPFQESPADAEILKDTSNYRVFWSWRYHGSESLFS
jgi:hypothetical protein